MDLRNLLGKLTLIEGTMKSAERHPTGPKFTGQWKGTDAGTPGNKMVGSAEESILKDLSKGPTPKTREQELAEAFDEFLEQLEEDNLGVEEKRPGRTSDRPRRDYGKTGEPSKRYKQVDEHGDPWEVDQQGRPVGWKAQEDEKDRAALAAHAKKYPNGDPRVKPLKAKDALGIAQKELNQAFGGDAKELTKKLSIRKDVNESTEMISKFRQELEALQASDKSPAEKQAIYSYLVDKFSKEAEEYKQNRQQIKEFGANQPQGTASQTSLSQQQPGQPAQQDPKQVAATNQALTAIKAATGTPAPTTNIAKALDAASQGKGVSTTDMKTLEPMMKDMTTVAQDPKLASQFKTLAQQIQQVQNKQQTPK